MLIIDRLWFSYTGIQPYVLQNINLEIAGGDYISFLGENGCGKTTLMRIILGFLKPTQGSITMGTNSIGYVPQRNDFSNVNFPITVFEVMNSYRKIMKIKKKDAISESLRLVGMENYQKSLMGNLSGGQTQKILLARAMMGEPELLILDEPSTGVDRDSQKEIYGVIKRMNTERRITVVTVEHNMEAVLSNSTKIYHIQNGQGHLCSLEKYAEEYLRLTERTGNNASL